MAQRSPWFYVGVGCVVIIVLGLAVTALGGFWLFRSAKKLEEELKDPVARAEKVKKILGADELPEGYHALVAFSVPFVMETAILSDQEPDGSGVVPSYDATLMYVAQRGSVSTQGMSADGITAVVLIQCPNDKRGRMALWFGPDPDPGAELDPGALAGTPGDEAEIARFMGNFDFYKAG